MFVMMLSDVLLVADLSLFVPVGPRNAFNFRSWVDVHSRGGGLALKLKTMH